MNAIGPWPETEMRAFAFRTLRGLDTRTTTERWVTIDENPIVIKDGWFVGIGNLGPLNVAASPGQVGNFLDMPATYHNNAGGLSFADGHAEIYKWSNPVLLKGKTSPTDYSTRASTPGIKDWYWLRYRTANANQPTIIWKMPIFGRTATAGGFRQDFMGSGGVSIAC